MPRLKLRAAPLELEFDERSFTLFFEGKALKPSVRTLGEMTPVLFDKRFASKAKRAGERVGERALYFMHRGVMRGRDEKVFAERRLRHDVTIISPALLGREFNKTFGHYHAQAAAGLSYPEVYEVFAGEAHFLLQKRIAGGNRIEDVVLVKAWAGDKVIVPPNYGHVAINPSETKPVVVANLVERSFESDYKPFKKLGGGAYYETLMGFVSNKRYARLPLLRIAAAKALPENKVFRRSLYAEFLASPEKFAFLVDPGKIRMLGSRATR